MTNFRTIIEHMVPGYEPRHVEAYMRRQHGALEDLSEAQFRKEAMAALACIDASGRGEAEALARSYGL